MNLNFKTNFPFIIDAYSHIYGEEYRDIISEKICNTKICFYLNIDGELEYIKKLKILKKQEYLDEFLFFIDSNSDKQLYNKIIKILKGNIKYLFENDQNDKLYLLLENFNDNNYLLENNIFNSKLIMLNYLLNRNDIDENNCEKIIDDKILIEVERILKEYLALSKKYKDYEESFSSKENYLRSEEKICQHYEKEEKQKLFNEIYQDFPEYVRNKNSSKTFEELFELFFDDYDYGISLFRSEIINKLNSIDYENIDSVKEIVFLQNLFLSKIGFDVPKLKYDDINKDDIFKHVEFINNEIKRKRLFNKEFVDDIINKYKLAISNGKKKYYMNREDYINFVKENWSLKDIEDISIYEIVNKSMCIVDTTDNDDKLNVLLYFGIDKNVLGILSYCFMHECCHVIDEGKYYCGFDMYGYSQVNSFNQEYRKYERFNETITDMLAIEAIEYLEKCDIYMFEDKSIIDEDKRWNSNTSSLNKELLYPLLNKYRKHVIDAKINSDPRFLIDYIGEENYEELVFLLNWLDDLCFNGLTYSISNNINDKLTEQYYFILTRKEVLYQKIDDYYNRNMSKKYVIGNSC